MFRNLTQDDYSELLTLDSAIYPTDFPVTPSILNTWFKKNPEFGMVHEKDSAVLGYFIVIPLNKEGWSKIISGELEECDLDESCIFDVDSDKERISSIST